MSAKLSTPRLFRRSRSGHGCLCEGERAPPDRPIADHCACAMAAERLPLFSVAVKDTKQIDHLVFKAADLDTKTTSWKVEIHDQSWPHTKTLTYEVKKLTKSSDWDTLTVRIRPQKEGRMLAWRATYVAGSVQGAWSPDWTPVVPADERQRDLDTGNKKWEKIFAPYVPYVPAPPGRPYVPVMAHGS